MCSDEKGAEIGRLRSINESLQLRLNAADQRIDDVERALGGMLFAFDGGVGRDWSADLLDHARKLTSAVELKPSGAVCRGSTALGTACGKCARCLAPPGEVKFKGMIETACGTFAIMIDEANAHYGWTFQRHPDGMWVSGRKATEAEMNAARAHAKVLALFQPS